MKLSKYLVQAEMAVVHTNSKMTKGSSNIPLDVMHMAMKHKTNDVDGMKKQMSDYIKKQREYYKGPVWVKNLGDAAERSGMGNCMERAAVAFNYLEAMWPQSGLAYFFMKGGGESGANHAFVVLGLSKKPPDEEEISYRETKPQWGDNAVVCDPWYHEWFVVADDWTRKGCQILQSTSGIELEEGTKITFTLIKYI